MNRIDPLIIEYVTLDKLNAHKIDNNTTKKVLEPNDEKSVEEHEQFIQLQKYLIKI